MPDLAGDCFYNEICALASPAVARSMAIHTFNNWPHALTNGAIGPKSVARIVFPFHEPKFTGGLT